VTRSRRGSLVVVGTGITGVNQITLEALAAIETADRLFYIANDPVTEAWLRFRNASAATLSDLYARGKPRHTTYADMAARVVLAVEGGADVCVAVYGHPGIFVQFSHVAIKHLRRRGYAARMLPGVSADGCLFADVGFNPGDYGVQSFEATDFLLHRRRFDPTSALLLWQVGVLGESDLQITRKRRPERLQRLVTSLRRFYPARHPVTLYRSNTFPGQTPTITRVALSRVTGLRISPIATMYVPPLAQRRPAREVLAWLEEGVSRT
jgi:precorrin-3B methylase